MFESLTSKLQVVFNKMKGRGTLSEADVDSVLREIRISLLESDVALSVVKKFTTEVREKALGAEILGSLNPAHLVIKIVHDHLVEVLGGETQTLKFQGYPASFLMVGLQGSGKTTTSAKVAKWLHEKEKKKVLLVSLDVYRPAAQEQLAILARNIGVESLDIIPSEKPLEIAKRALKKGMADVFDVVVFDTAGRVHLDDDLMQEIKDLQKLIKPSETLIVLDSLTGQDAVNTAQGFMNSAELTGVILTRMDGDARGGAALSMRSVTGCPIKFVGLGEKVEALEVFHPERVADRILDKGDIVSLVEKTIENINVADAEKMARKLQKGSFDLQDFSVQIEQMIQMGGFKTLMDHMPGMESMKSQIPMGAMDDKVLTRQLAIIRSMTSEERKNPDILNASRKRRIAKGSGVQVQDVNRLLKMFQEMGSVAKKFGKFAKLSKMTGKMNFLKGGLKGILPGRMK